MLIIFGGLPGTGKTTLARKLSRTLGAVYLRIDTIEEALRRSASAPETIGELGYEAGFALADDNLRNGLTVVADSVNPLVVTRDKWRRIAEEAELPYREIEVRCSDTAEHRKRVEGRSPDVPGMKLPTWQQVLDRRYEPWGSGHLVVETSGRSVEECLKDVAAFVSVDG